jgi:hypothetical protein
VYALLGLGSPGPTLDADYTISEAETFTRLAITFLFHGGDHALEILAMAPDLQLFPEPGVSLERLADLPTWVPDLRLQQVEWLSSATIQPARFHAGGTLQPAVRLDQERNILSVRGKVVDIVETTALTHMEHLHNDLPDTQHGLSKQDTARRLRRTLVWLKECRDLAIAAAATSNSSAACPVESEETAFSRTMLFNMDIGHNPLPDGALDAFPAYVKWLDERAGRAERATAQDELAAIVIETPDSPYCHLFETSLASLAATRRFGVAQSARLCHLPTSARPGDQICIFAGGEVPFVIRQTSPTNHELIGACYLDGAMQGDALYEADGESSLRWIDLQ